MKKNNNREQFTLGIKRLPFNARLRTARESRGWTQKKLAEVTGLKSAAINSYENLRSWPPRNNAEKICTVLDLDISYVFPEWMKEFIKPRGLDFNIYVNIDKVALDAPEVLSLPDSVSVNKPTMEDGVEKELLADDVLEALKTLNDRERAILEFRFGLNKRGAPGPATYERVGREFGITRERVRQIEQKALRKLRNPAVSKGLRDYL
jgi:RNA polymerase sigma factor (sigma-70 family)